MCRPSIGGKRVYCYSTTDPEAKYVNTQSGKTEKLTSPQFNRKLGDVKRFIITSAQNATPIHEGFFKALMAYCKKNDAELVVIPIRYKNPTSRWTESQRNDERWAPELMPYLYNQRKKLCKSLVLLGDIKTRPTAQSPLTGFEGITHGESGILGHSKLQLRTIPTPQHSLPKILTTTGSCTVKNYTDSKAGKKGEFHHVIGACVVDIVGGIFHMRQVNATKDGTFIDLQHMYIANGTVGEAPRALGLVMGDTHMRFADPQVIGATFDRGGMVDTLNPEVLVWHDLLDGYSANPHHFGNPFIEIAKRRANMHIVEDEIRETVSFLRKHTRAGHKSIVVASNHDDFFQRWIMNTDWRRDPDNASFYLETAKLMADSAHMDKHGATYLDPFTYWVEKLKDNPDISCLAVDESFMLGDSEVGFHGHRGPHGARGTVKNLSRLGVRVITGHGHAPAIEEGHYRTGTSTYLKLEYTEGPSAWLNTHCVVYANGKRSLINVIEGEWRLSDNHVR
jgi:hypothetical protein